MNSEGAVLKCAAAGCGKEFRVIGPEEKFYQLKGLPLPSNCPTCRHKQRMALRSERQLYRRTCAKCKNSMLTTYPADAPYTIYCQECFWANIG